VVAPSAGEAEAHATALAIMPLDQAAAYLAGHPRLSAIVVPATTPPFTIGGPPLLAWTPQGREVAA
jgi:thiamine biosynthesis lipoprotein ApbE